MARTRNRTAQPRRSLVTHCISSDCRFHPTEVSHIYSRYKRIQDDTMDESFFPILWTRTGHRTPHLDVARHRIGRLATVAGPDYSLSPELTPISWRRA